MMPTAKVNEILNAQADISNQLGRIEQRVNDTHNLAVKTNGRVTVLEGELIAKRAIDNYKKSQRAMYISLLVAFGTILGAMWWLRK